jgi:hypothetical protein
VTWLRTAVRRWGWKTVGAVITAFGIYVVLPSVITLMGAWPDLGNVRPWWFLVLAGLELASFATLWVLVRIALPHTPWAAAATSQVVGNAAAKVLEARIYGTPLEALCGHVWVPSRDPKQLPVCEKCKGVYEMYKAFNDGLRDTPED